MEPLAENRFVITKPLFFEGMLRVIREGYGPFAKKVLALLALLWAALAAVTLFTNGSPAYVLVELVVIVLIGVWMWVFVPRSRARKAWAALESKSGGDLERVTRFYPTFLEIASGGEETVILYEEVKQILLSARLLVLTCEGGAGVLVARGGFTVGDAAAVQALIKQEMKSA